MTNLARNYRKFVDNPYEGVRRDLVLLLSREPLGRAMTPMERICLAVADAEPTNYLTLDSKDLNRNGVSEAWAKLRKRINRQRATPLIYFAVPALSHQGTGHHIHTLLWEYMSAKWLNEHLPQVGFGGCKIKRISQTPLQRLEKASYVLGQNEAVFGSYPHRRHVARKKSAMSYFKPEPPTLERFCPKLLSGMKQAQSQLVSDAELVSGLTMFRGKG